MATQLKSRPLGPFKLVTVNTAPDRARRIVGRVCEEVREKYDIDYLANTDSIDGVKAVVEENQPDLLFTASMWTPDEAQRIVSIAKKVVPSIRTFSLPQGLQVEKGPDGVVEYIKEHLPELLEH